MAGLLYPDDLGVASNRDVYAHIGGPTSPRLGGGAGPGAVGGLFGGLLGGMQKANYDDEVYRQKLEYDVMTAIQAMDSQTLAQFAQGLIRGPDRQSYISAAQNEMSMRRPKGR